MKRAAYILLIALLIVPCMSVAGTIDEKIIFVVKIKGVDDGIRTSKQQDYKEAVYFAKREVIERFGAEAVLLRGYKILDIGYSADGAYQVVLLGRVKTLAEGIDSKELRYAKSLVDRGERSKAKKVIDELINNSKDGNVVAEAIYWQVLWRFAPNDRDTFEKLKANYPYSKYVSRLEVVIKEREKKQSELEAKYGREIGHDGLFIAYATGVVYDKNTGLEWYAGPDRDTNWYDAKKWVENLNVGGGRWRMPTMDELKTLYQKGAGTRNMTPLLKTTGWWVWAMETTGSSTAWLFLFDGGIERWNTRDYPYYGRGFAVRSRK